MDLCTKERFLGDVKAHKMEIIQDDGLYRHLVFSDGTCHYKFGIITWPGYLTIYGDMGCWVFARIPNMFHFFGPHDEELSINSGYWSEKLQACDRIAGGYERFDEHMAREGIMEIVNEDWEYDSDDQKAEVVASITEDLETKEFEYEFYDWAFGYESDYGHTFSDFWEHSFQRYDYRYIWCLYAIVWGIQQYEKEKS